MGAAKRDDNREVALIAQNILGTQPLFITGLSLTNATPLHVAMVDGSGNQLKGFGNIGLAPYDYVSRSLAGDGITETWTFKTGGSGGTTTNTIVIVYTDSTLATISTVTKT